MGDFEPVEINRGTPIVVSATEVSPTNIGNDLDPISPDLTDASIPAEASDMQAFASEVEPTPSLGFVRRHLAKHNPNTVFRTGVSIVLLSAAGGLAVAACGTSAAETPTHLSTGHSDNPELKKAQDISEEPVVTETEADLASGGYNCGHTLGTGESYEKQIDYLNSDQTLARNIMAFQISDPIFGMGEAAWQVIEKNAVINSATPSTAVSEANNDSNEYSHFITPVTLTEPVDALNFTCDAPDRPNEVTPINEIKVTDEVNVIVLTQEGLNEFNAVSNKYPDGQSKFVVIPLGSQEISDPSTSQTTSQEVFGLVTEAGGCNNPLRATMPPEKHAATPPRPTTTTANHPITTSPNHFFPTTTATTFGRKVDTYTDPPGPNKTTPNTTTPEKTNPGTPDNGEPNPVGTTEPPTIPPTTIGESSTTTATVPPETTVPPTTTPTQPGF